MATAAAEVTPRRQRNCVQYRGRRYATLDFKSPTESWLHHSPSSVRSRSRSRSHSRRTSGSRPRSTPRDLGQTGDYIALPRGWHLAPQRADVVKNVVAAYTWETSLLLMADGSLFTTRGHPAGPGQNYSHLRGRFFLQDKGTAEGTQYRVSAGNCRILIRSDHRSHTESRQSLGDTLWHQRLFTDCTVVSGGEAVPCHRAVLASASPVLQAMLDSSMSEAAARQVEFTDVSSCAVLAFIKFVYTGAIDFAEVDPIEVLLLADRYEVSKLAVAAYQPVIDKLSADNIVMVSRALNNFSARSGYEKLWTDFCKHVQKDSKLFSAAMKAL